MYARALRRVWRGGRRIIDGAQEVLQNHRRGDRVLSRFAARSTPRRAAARRSPAASASAGTVLVRHRRSRGCRREALVPHRDRHRVSVATLEGAAQHLDEAKHALGSTALTAIELQRQPHDNMAYLTVIDPAQELGHIGDLAFAHERLPSGRYDAIGVANREADRPSANVEGEGPHGRVVTRAGLAAGIGRRHPPHECR